MLEECHSKYPEYTIYDNIKIAKSAAQHQFSRDSEESLLGVIQDIHMLSLTNYVVCTHTSNVRQDCRQNNLKLTISDLPPGVRAAALQAWPGQQHAPLSGYSMGLPVCQEKYSLSGSC